LHPSARGSEIAREGELVKANKLAVWCLCVSAAVCAAFLGARSARADDDSAPDFGRSGFYLGAGASRSVNFIQDYLDHTALNNVKVDDAWGANGRAGYRVASWFAVEGEYEWIDALNLHFGNFDFGSIKTQIATANFRLIAPLGRFQPYFLGGVGAVFFRSDSLRIDHTSFAGRVGLGLDVYLTQSFLLNVAAEGMLSDAKVQTGFGSFEHGLAMLNIQFGLGYRF
jgi:opacity protein-like surface antigen